MTSRDDILASIRAKRPKVDRPLPPVPLFDACPPASLLAAFKKGLERMGGIFLEPPGAGDPLEPVRARIAEARVVCSTVPEFSGNRDIAAAGGPQNLADVDFARVRAAFGVPETGSVLLHASELRVNALAYLAQHLIDLLDPSDIVVNLTTHTAGRSSETAITPHFTLARRRRPISRGYSSTVPRASGRFPSCPWQGRRKSQDADRKPGAVCGTAGSFDDGRCR